MKIFAHLNWLYATLVIFTGLTLKILLYKLLPRPWGSKVAAWFIRTLIFTHVQRIGTPDPEAQMMIINHQSELDIGVVESTTSKDLAWVAKKELFDVPFFSLAVSLSDDIPLERESKKALVHLLHESKERIDAGRIICIFPEGTRSESGKMRPFKAGARIIAERFALHVQPVVLIRTAHYYSNKTFTARPGIIRAVFLQSVTVDPDDGEWFKRMQQQMQATYDRYAAQPAPQTS